MAGTAAEDGGVISNRALNRATLARQLLLERTDRSVLDVLRHLVGVQGQAPNPPYIGLWTRIHGFEIEQLTTLLESKQAVRSTILRATIHVLASDDFLAFRAMMQPIFVRGLQGSWGKSLVGADLDAVEAFGREFMSEAPRNAHELRRELAARFPGFDPQALTAVTRYLLPLVHVPPGGTWEYHKPSLLTPPLNWLGRDLEPAGTPDALILRYLAAFGPATVQDFQKWSGLTRAGEAAERLRPQLRVLRDENGIELLDLPGASLPSDDVPAPVRLLPEWDNVLLAYEAKTRQRILPDAYRGRVFTNNGLIRATVLVDGFVAGAWKLERWGEAATVVVELFEDVAGSAKEAIEAEAMALLATFAKGRSHAVEFRPSIGVEKAAKGRGAE